MFNPDEEFQEALDESDGDEDYAALPEFHRFVIPEGCHWDNVRETTQNVGLKIESSLREIESANQEFLYGIFGDAQWSNKNSLPADYLWIWSSTSPNTRFPVRSLPRICSGRPMNI